MRITSRIIWQDSIRAFLPSFLFELLDSFESLIQYKCQFHYISYCDELLRIPEKREKTAKIKYYIPVLGFLSSIILYIHIKLLWIGDMTALLDLDSLRTLVMIADTGSFTRAAEELDKTQSAISMQMRRMEDKLERTIFRREGRHSKLTEDGELLLRHARQMLRLNDETLAMFSEREVTGKVRLGLAEGIDETRTAKIIFEFSKNNPKAEASIVCAPAADLRKALEAGELDLAIIGSLADEAENGEGSVLSSERLVWAAGSNFKLASEKELPLAVGLEQCRIRKAAVEALEDDDRAFRIQYSSSNPGLVEMTAASGMAITIQPRSSLVSSDAGLLELEGLPKLPNYVVKLVRGKESHFKAANALSDHLAKSFEKTAASA